MAESTALPRISLDDVRASVKRVQAQGEKLVTQLGKDARKLASRATVTSLDDARKRATQVVRELDARRTRVREMLQDQLATLLATARRTLGLASTVDLMGLTRRVAGLEQTHATSSDVQKLALRIAELERRLEALTKKTHAA